MPGAQVRRPSGWATRITWAEVAAMNRNARFPASHCVGVLRTASALNLGRPPTVPIHELCSMPIAAVVACHTE